MAGDRPAAKAKDRVQGRAMAVATVAAATGPAAHAVPAAQADRAMASRGRTRPASRIPMHAARSQAARPVVVVGRAKGRARAGMPAARASSGATRTATAPIAEPSAAGTARAALPSRIR